MDQEKKDIYLILGAQPSEKDIYTYKIVMKTYK